MTKKTDRHRGARHRSPQAATGPADATAPQNIFCLDPRSTGDASPQHHRSGASPLIPTPNTNRQPCQDGAGSSEGLAQEEVAPPAEVTASKNSADDGLNQHTDDTEAGPETLSEPPACDKLSEEASAPQETVSKADTASAAPRVAASASPSSPSPASAPTSPTPEPSPTPDVQDSYAAATQAGLDPSPPPDPQESCFTTPDKVQPVSESGSDPSPSPAGGEGSVKKPTEALPKMIAFSFSSGSGPSAPSRPSASRDAAPAFGSLKVRDFNGSPGSSPSTAAAPSISQEGAAPPIDGAQSAGFQFGRSESSTIAASGSSARLRPGARGKTAAAVLDTTSSADNTFTGFTQLGSAAAPNPFAGNAFGSAAQSFTFGSAAAGTPAFPSFGASSVGHANSSPNASPDVMAVMRAIEERCERRLAECGERLAGSEQRLTQQEKVNHELRLELNLVKAKLGLKDSAAVLKFLSQCGEDIIGGADACLYVHGGLAGVTGRALQRQQAQFERQLVHSSQLVLDYVFNERSLRHLQLRMGLTTPLSSAQVANNGGLARLLEVNLSRFYEEILHEVDQRNMHALAQCQKLAVVCEGHCEEAERKLWLATPPKLRDNTAVSFTTQGTAVSSRIEELNTEASYPALHSPEADASRHEAQTDDQSLDMGNKDILLPAPLDIKKTLTASAPDGVKNDGAPTGIHYEPATVDPPATAGSKDGPASAGSEDGPALAAAPSGIEDDPTPAPISNKEILENLKCADSQLGTRATEPLHEGLASPATDAAQNELTEAALGDQPSAPATEAASTALPADALTPTSDAAASSISAVAAAAGTPLPSQALNKESALASELQQPVQPVPQTGSFAGDHVHLTLTPEGPGVQVRLTAVQFAVPGVFHHTTVAGDHVHLSLTAEEAGVRVRLTAVQSAELETPHHATKPAAQPSSETAAMQGHLANMAEPAPHVVVDHAADPANAEGANVNQAASASDGLNKDDKASKHVSLHADSTAAAGRAVEVVVQPGAGYCPCKTGVGGQVDSEDEAEEDDRSCEVYHKKCAILSAVGSVVVICAVLGAGRYLNNNTVFPT